MRSSASLAARISSSLRIGSSVFVIVCDQSRRRAASVSGMPSMRGDDEKGEREREVADDVDRPRRVERVERGVDELFDERAQVGDDPWCEGFLHEPPQPGVVRGVGAEHRLRRWPPGPAQNLLDAIVEEIVVERDADRRIPQHPVDVVVAQEQPGAERRLLDRVLGVERRVDRIGVDEEIGTEQFVRSDHV